MIIKKVALTLSLALAASSSAFADKQFVTIGTGGVTGVYYPTGGSICRLVNKDTKKHDVRCSVVSTGGSIYNINAIRSGDIELGVAQSDWQFHAYNGSSKFKEQGKFKELRSVFSVHAEPFTVVARKDANIKTFNDLKGKRVNFGPQSSGTYATAKVLLDSLGWTFDDFKLASELKPAEQSRALCDNKIDAVIYVVGHPSGSIKEATTACDTNLVNVTGGAVEKLVFSNPYYRIAAIHKDLYGSSQNILTFGVGATFVASTKVSDDVVYNIVKAVFENFDEFKRLHPAFAHLKKKEMISDSNSAPLHNGAIKYYTEAGLM
ncbi:MAG: TAXI family TRAP transporter solute-binding subunit [Cellvibrionaceae bacterium]